MKARLLFLLIIFTLGFGINNKASAATRTWKGNSLGLWNNPADWVEGAVPNNTDNVFIGSGTTVSNQPVIIGIAGICRSLTVSNNQSVTITIAFAGLTVTNSITVGNQGFTITGLGTLHGNTTMSMTNGGTCTFNAPLIIDGAATANGTTLAGNSDIEFGSFSTSGAVNFTTSGAVTVDALTNVSGGTLSISNTSLFQTVDLTTGQQVNINAPFQSTGTFTQNNAAINSNASGKMDLVDLASTNGNTFTLQAILNVTGTFTPSGTNTITVSNTAATNINNINTTMGSNATGNTLAFKTALKVTGVITSVSGYTVITNNSTTTLNNVGDIKATAGTLQIGNSGQSTAFTGVDNTSSVAAGTLTLYNGSITTATMNLGGPLNIYGTDNITSAGTANTIVGGIKFQNTSYTLNFLGAGTTTVTGTSTSPGSDVITVATTHTLNFGAGALFNISSGSTGGITNNGKLNFQGTATKAVKYTTSTPGTIITNSSTGTTTATYTTFDFSGDSNSGFANSNVFNTSNCTIKLGASSDRIINNAGTFTGATDTITMAGNSSNITCSAGTMTFNAGTRISTTGNPANIVNAGNFFAGTTNGSYCTISFGNQGGITNSSFFYLGSTSLIDLGSADPCRITNSGYFTFQSDAYGSASLAKLNSDKQSIFGNSIYVERYLTGGGTNSKYRGYRLLSSATNISSSVSGTGNTNISYVNTQPVNELNTYAALTAGVGGGTNGFSIANAAPTLYLYREKNPTNATTFTSGRFVGVSKVTSTNVDYVSTVAPLTGTASIPVGNGFLFYFIGNTSSTVTSSASRPNPEPTTITNSGYVNQQNVPVTIGAWSVNSTSLSYTSALGATDAGYNLLGNPYPSVIDLKKLYTDNGQAYTTFYELTDVNPSQGYVSYKASDSTKSSTTYSSRFIASGQGFFVKATTTGQTVTFKEDIKVYSPSGILYYNSTPPVLLSLKDRKKTDALVAEQYKGKPAPLTTNSIIPETSGMSGLHLMVHKDSLTFRECGLYFKPGFDDKFDNEDAFDLDGPGLKVFLSSYSSDGIRTGINEMGDYTKGKRVKLFTKASIDGQYNFTLTDLQHIDTTTFAVYLVDNFKKDSLDIGRYGTYKFDINNADTNSYGANRFVLAINRRPLPPYQLITFDAEKATDGVFVKWKTYNEGNFTGFTLQKQDASGQFVSLYSLQSSNATNYFFTDINPITGANTYRLQQNDIDGKITYSTPVTVNYGTIAVITGDVFSVYPSPSRDLITINYTPAKGGAAPNYVSKIYNTAGQVVGERNITSNSWTENVSSYRAGIYIILLKDNNGAVVGKTKFAKTN